MGTVASRRIVFAKLIRVNSFNGEIIMFLVFLIRLLPFWSSVVGNRHFVLSFFSGYPDYRKSILRYRVFIVQTCLISLFNTY